MKQYLVTESTEKQDGLGQFTHETNRVELKPGAVMLTREEVARVLDKHFLKNTTHKKQLAVLDALFGKQENV